MDDLEGASVTTVVTMHFAKENGQITNCFLSFYQK